MLRSATPRRLLRALSSSSRVRHLSITPDAAFPRPAGPPPPPPPPQQQQKQQGASDSPPPPPPPPPPGTSVRSEQGDGGPQRRRAAEGRYEEEQARVLCAALSHVVRLGWSESAMIFGAKDVGVSPSIIGTFPRKEAALVEFFMDDCLERLLDRIESGEELKDLILSERLAKLIRIRLEMQIPYISKWPQALSIQAQPLNLPTAIKQRAQLVDEIWHASGDQSSEIDWYVKRTVLGGIYSTSEVYMLTDHSPEFRDTWTFLEHRIKDAFDLQKTVQEATYLAEAVGAGVGNSMQGFMKRFFQG